MKWYRHDGNWGLLVVENWMWVIQMNEEHVGTVTPTMLKMGFEK